MAKEILDWQNKNWVDEANSVIKDVENHVKKIEISDKLVTDGSCIFINVKYYLDKRSDFINEKIKNLLKVITAEDKTFTVLLDALGFKIVSHAIDSCDEKIEDESDEVYETIYALLQKHSDEYIKRFGNALIDKLEKIQ